MRAVTYSKGGDVSVMELCTDAPEPVFEKGKKKLLVRVSAASLNPVDWKIRTITIASQKFPFCAGSDLCGVVEACDSDSSFQKGDRVWSLLPILDQEGALSDKILIDEKICSKCPSNLSDEECAALPLVGLTVLQSMERANIVPENADSLKGKSILIHAGSGGVGNIAIQYAKQCGLSVYTTCSGRNTDFVKTLGADRAIDYTKERFEDVAGDKFDFVFDTMGGNYELRSMKIIKPTGTYINIMNSGWATKLGSKQENPDGVTSVDSIGSIVGFLYAGYRMIVQCIVGPYYKFCIVKPSKETLEKLASLCETEKIKAILDSSYVIEDYAKAFNRLETGHARGKVVVKISTCK